MTPFTATEARIVSIRNLMHHSCLAGLLIRIRCAASLANSLPGAVDVLRYALGYPVKLDNAILGARIELTVPGLRQCLEISAHRVDRFRAVIGRDGREYVEFCIHSERGNEAALQYCAQVGDAAGVCRVVPLQVEIGG